MSATAALAVLLLVPLVQSTIFARCDTWDTLARHLCWVAIVQLVKVVGRQCCDPPSLDPGQKVIRNLYMLTPAGSTTRRTFMQQYGSSYLSELFHLTRSPILVQQSITDTDATCRAAQQWSQQQAWHLFLVGSRSSTSRARKARASGPISGSGFMLRNG